MDNERTHSYNHIPSSTILIYSIHFVLMSSTDSHEASRPALIPSQTLNASAGSFRPSPAIAVAIATTNEERKKEKKKNNRRTAKPKETADPSKVTQRVVPERTNHANTTEQYSTTGDQNNQQNHPMVSKKSHRTRNRNKGAKQDPNTGTTGNNRTVPTFTSNEMKKPARRKRNTTNNNITKHPWRQHIPEGAMDPITLDPLVSIAYPPFALCAQAPFIPVEEWPVKENNNRDIQKLTKEDRELQILQQQWGEVSLQEPVTITPPTPQQRHYNLYDGRALAYYLVSQLQFIDPLNRRDLTRDELVTLDRYLTRHGFDKKFKVLEAYDAKGVTLSTAGAAGNTADGRAIILQQEAQVLLNSLFAGPTTILQQQYQAQQHQEQHNRHRARTTTTQRGDEDFDFGINEQEGLTIIDDDENPGLRGGGLHRANTNNGTLWSASHISNQYSNAANVREQNFPSLSAPTPLPASVPLPVTASVPPSKSLLRISKVVSKTNAKELERQREAREAREAFVRRAQMSNLSYTGDGSIATHSSQQVTGLFEPPTTFHSLPPTEGQLLRNQAFASALGVAPATVRQQTQITGWARPTNANMDLDEFGNELNVALYPDNLILKARERMELTVKMERKWIRFLEDDKAASLPLTKMDRSTRVFVHEYSDFWKLHTESFDPEPKRYIHCVKLRDTSVPRPLLSEAARNWRGPRLLPRVEQEHPIKQTAGQTPREFPLPQEQDQLRLQPRTLPFGFVPPPGAMNDFEIDTPNQLTNTRSNEEFNGRERPKLLLAARTLPLENPVQGDNAPKFSVTDERERQKVNREERARQEQHAEEKKRRALEAAFASDSDEEEKSLASHDSDEWNDVLDQQPQYIGGDEE